MRRRMLASLGGAKLPYDAEVEWLMSNAIGSYIDLGVGANGETEAECNASIESTQQERGMLFGSRSAWNRAAFAFFKATGQVYITVSYGNTGNPSLVQFTTVNVTDRIKRKYAIKSGVEISAGGVTRKFNRYEFNTPTNLLLFAYSENGVVYGSKSTVYDFKLWQGGELIRDLVPVRFTNENGVSEGAMYDRRGVGGMNPDGSARVDGLYRNRGTGTFITGPDK